MFIVVVLLYYLVVGRFNRFIERAALARARINEYSPTRPGAMYIFKEYYNIGMIRDFSSSSPVHRIKTWQPPTSTPPSVRKTDYSLYTIVVQSSSLVTTVSNSTINATYIIIMIFG